MSAAPDCRETRFVQIGDTLLHNERFISVRECRARISKELQEGSFCLSSTHRPGGYFRPSPGEKGRQELLRFYRRELSRSRSSARKLKTVRTALEECEGQETAFDIEPLE